MATQATMNDVIKYLTERKFRFSQNESGTVARFRVNLKNGEHEIVVVLDPAEGDVIRVIHWFPFNVPENKRSEMCEFLCRLNYQKKATTCQMNLDDGVVGCRTCLFVKDGGFVPAHFETALDWLMGTADDYLPLLLSFLYGGKSAKQVCDDAVKQEQQTAQK